MKIEVGEASGDGKIRSQITDSLFKPSEILSPRLLWYVLAFVHSTFEDNLSHYNPMQRKAARIRRSRPRHTDPYMRELGVQSDVCWYKK